MRLRMDLPGYHLHHVLGRMQRNPECTADSSPHKYLGAAPDGALQGVRDCRAEGAPLSV